MDPKEEKIRVAVRVRPLSTGGCPGEREGEGEAIAASRDGHSVLVYADTSRTSAASFRCGTFLSSTIRQDQVFDEIRAPELVEAALDGFPVTIFAYGQTGAGKSFTIFGKEESPASSRPYGGSAVSETDGILPRAALRLMEIVDARKGVFEYTLRVTCVEIYNEQVRDLFDTKKESLPVRHSADHGFYLENATVVQCQTAREIIRVVKLAAMNRTKSAHLLNERSNRSHCLVTIYIDSTPCGPSCGAKKYGKLTIVDLAGSERANDTGAVGQQLKETGHINKSLYCLSKVIHAMTTTTKATGKAKFVPYRDSKLTMVRQTLV
jgi:kinesin family member 12